MLIRQRLDRVWANFVWNMFVPESKVFHLPKVHSDHNPLKLVMGYEPLFKLTNLFVLSGVGFSMMVFLNLTKFGLLLLIIFQILSLSLLMLLETGILKSLVTCTLRR